MGSVAWLLLPCGSCVTCLFLEGHFGIHLEVASGPFCLIVNSPWPLVFVLCLFFLFLLGFNLYCLKGIHFSWSYSLMVLQLHLFFGLIFCSNIWFSILIVLSLGAVIAIFSGIIFNGEKILGSKNLLPSSSCTLSLYHLVLTFVGILLTFSPMHFLGFNVMPRRVPDFPDSFHSWNFLSSIGSGVTFLSFAIK